jgi:hypothetical protein
MAATLMVETSARLWERRRHWSALRVKLWRQPGGLLKDALESSTNPGGGSLSGL